MLLRSSLSAAGALLLATGALAQQDASAKIFPAPAVKDAGIYHLATGTWTRAKSPVAMIGTDVLYDNTCQTGFYYGGLSSGQSAVDSGRLPSPGSPDNAQSETGTASSYLVDGIQVGYCTGEIAETITLNYYNCYTACSDATGLVPDASLLLTGMPGLGGGTGAGACWVVTIDLALTSAQFNLQADCDGTYDGAASLDNFGWGIMMANPQTGAINSGPFICGDPFGITTGTACPYGDGTTWSGNGNPGTGIGTDDFFEKDGAGVIVGCFFFGGYLSGNPYSSFYHQLIGDAAGGPVTTGTAYCNADGVNSTPCPCGNDNDGTNGVAGCANGSTNNGAGGGALTATGAPSISGNTVVMTCTNVQNNQPGLFFRADNAVNGGSGITFGDGLRCAGGNIVRLGIFPANGSGVATISSGVLAGLSAGDVKRFQYWYRNPANSPCGASFNLSNGYEITAQP